MTDAVRTLKEWTDTARKIVFFGGAGVAGIRAKWIAVSGEIMYNEG